MAMAAGGGGGLTNEINVTPMIDVLLVLLIIFMAAIPTLRKSIDVQLPDPTPSVVPANAKSDQIVLEVNPDGTYSINTEKVSEDRLGPRLKEIYENRPEKIIFVKGDPKVKYGQVVHAMDVSRGSGVKVIGVPPKDTPGAEKK
jgi:biopolymer transport protein TolR